MNCDARRTFVQHETTVMFVFTNVSSTSNVEFDLDQSEQLIHSYTLSSIKRYQLSHC